MQYPACPTIPQGSPGGGGAPLYPSLHSYQDPNSGAGTPPYPPSPSAGGFVTGETGILILILGICINIVNHCDVGPAANTGGGAGGWNF